jgi:hypothetical protein
MALPGLVADVPAHAAALVRDREQVRPVVRESRGDVPGICFGDSGSPKLIPHTNTIVALASGGDAICRALNNNQPPDVADARAFLGRYVQLP